MGVLTRIIILIVLCAFIIGCTKKSTVESNKRRSDTTTEPIGSEEEPTIEAIPIEGEVKTVGYNLGGKGAIKVFLRESTKHPHRSAKVTIYRIEPPTMLEPRKPILRKIETRDCTDVCVFTYLKPNYQYKVVVADDGHEESQKVWVRENTLTVTTIVLKGPGTIKIIVHDYFSGEPIGGAKVTLRVEISNDKSWKDKYSEIGRCTTDSSGECTFEIMNPGGRKYQVTAETIHSAGYEVSSTVEFDVHRLSTFHVQKVTLDRG
jgi:hypothetical protein